MFNSTNVFENAAGFNRLIALKLRTKPLHLSSLFPLYPPRKRKSQFPLPTLWKLTKLYLRIHQQKWHLRLRPLHHQLMPPLYPSTLSLRTLGKRHLIGMTMMTKRWPKNSTSVIPISSDSWLGQIFSHEHKKDHAEPRFYKYLGFWPASQSIFFAYSFILETMCSSTSAPTPVATLAIISFKAEDPSTSI